MKSFLPTAVVIGLYHSPESLCLYPTVTDNDLSAFRLIWLIPIIDCVKLDCSVRLPHRRTSLFLISLKHKYAKIYTNEAIGAFALYTVLISLFTNPFVDALKSLVS